ncbi:MAG: glycosyltransferase, partial [Clostridium sp.]|nr:glycosyltransferase [Clostridium sp.]
MKKKILFIEEGLGIGGAEKSLLAILNLLDYSKYEVDLFLFRHNGEFMNMLPKEVNLLKASEDF